MSIRTNKYAVKDLIVPQNVLVSVFDKTGLGEVVNGILQVNPKAVFYSTGGTGERLKDILRGPGPHYSKEIVRDESQSKNVPVLVERTPPNYVSVENFTRCPEMEGGLVKTLHPKIHAGLLAERGNLEHERYLNEEMKKMTGTPGVYFDVVIGNLYPFEEVVSRGAGPEEARVNIDIGGPTMMMAAAKNWHSVAVLSSPEQYTKFVNVLLGDEGTRLDLRFYLASEAMESIAKYRSDIAKYFLRRDFTENVEQGLKVEE